MGGEVCRTPQLGRVPGILQAVNELPALPGTYVLVIDVPHPLRLVVGRLGCIGFIPGRYLYVGSARGPGGLRARISRHVRTERRQHWHIDALTDAAPVTEVWYDDGARRLECAWAALLAGMPGCASPVPGFGASDCACSTHLFLPPPGSIEQAYAALTQAVQAPGSKEKRT